MLRLSNSAKYGDIFFGNFNEYSIELIHYSMHLCSPGSSEDDDNFEMRPRFSKSPLGPSDISLRTWRTLMHENHF